MVVRPCTAPPGRRWAASPRQPSMASTGPACPRCCKTSRRKTPKINRRTGKPDMPALRSALNPKAEAFQNNVKRMSERLAEVQALEAQVRRESAAKRDKFDKRGQLLPRERVARLLDRDSPFLELSTLDRKSTRLNSSHSQISYA